MKILHVFADEKFFDKTSDFFDTLDDVENLYYLYKIEKNYQFKYIKQTQKVILVNSFRKYSKLFSRPDIDVILFHSFNFNKYYLTKFIDKNKKVIWWEWGYDIYTKFKSFEPLVKLEIIKPLTEKYIKESDIKTIKSIHDKFLDIKRNIFFTTKITDKILLLCFYIKKLFLYPIRYINQLQWTIKNREYALNRIDYIKTVLPEEYDLIKQNSFIKAKPFLLHNGFCYRILKDFSYNETLGNIIIGNSLTFTNNHFDVFDIVKNIDIKDRKFIIPINYGVDYSSKEKFIEDSKMPKNTLWLTEFLPYEEYSKLYNSVTHVIMGHIRQQAVGNIFMCFELGIKLYLYKESIAYRSLIKMGYRVFTIEEDLTQESLSKVLSKQEAQNNYNKRFEYLAKSKENIHHEFNNMF